MVKSAVLCASSALALVASLYATQSFAADATAAASDATPGVVGELTVIANKREERIESVPVAVTAFSPKQREIIGIRTVQELSDFTPGLSYYAIADRAYIRGIGRNTVNLATAAGVAIYFNGIYYGANGSVSLQHDSLFIGNIEVDRGPQNSLHGSNADGGTINYTEKRPTSTLQAEARAGVANDGYYYGEAVISGPLSDNWRFRVGGNYSTQNGGYFHNFDGAPEGGSGPQGGGGNWHYYEAQLEGTIGHLDVWAMASSGDFDTNFHTVAAIGAIPETPFLVNGAEGLAPSPFYGLCAINSNGGPGCQTLGPTGTPGTVIPGSAVGKPVLASQFTGNNPGTANPHDFIETSVQHNTQNDDIALATNLTYHLPDLDITYLGGYQSFFYHLVFGPGYDSGLTSYQITEPTGPVTIFPSGDNTLFVERDQSFSHELDFTSTGQGAFQYISGLYWYHEHFEQPIGAACRPLQLQFQHPAGAAANPDGCAYNQDGLVNYDDYAAFAHGSYKFNDQWTFAGSLRYTSDHRSGSETQRLISFCGDVTGCNLPAIDVTAGAFAALLAPGVTPPKGAGPASILPNGNLFRTLSGSWSAFTGDATLNWTPDSTTLAYLRYARGYKAGGFAAGTFQGNAATGVAAYTAPEYVDSFELGLKKTIGSTFVANGAIFYYNFQNDQQPLGVSEAGGTVVTQLFNIPAVREYGLELEGSWKPIDPLTLSLEYSYLNTRITSMDGKCVTDSTDPSTNLAGDNTTGCAAGALNIVGAELPEAPPNKVALNGQYVLKFDPGNLTLSASYIWKDKTYGSIFNNPLNLAPSYSTVNLRATFDDAQGRYTLIAFVDNLTNELGYDNVTQSRIFPGTLIQEAGLTAPRTFGLEFQVRFK